MTQIGGASRRAIGSTSLRAILVLFKSARKNPSLFFWLAGNSLWASAVEFRRDFLLVYGIGNPY